MTLSTTIHWQRVAVAIEHEPVCIHCGHGESLHPLRDLACLLCDQSISAGLPSRLCIGFVTDQGSTGSYLRAKH